jgi:hypothetical protein
MNAWESIFLQSPANDGYYDEEELPQLKWEWPNGTWFQTRLDYTRDHEPLRIRKSHGKLAREKGFAKNELRA